MPNVPNDEEWRAREIERQDRRDANGRDARHGAAICIVIVIVVLILAAYLSSGG